MKWPGKFIADMLPVMAGILIALFLNDWKEKQDDDKYLSHVFASIEQEMIAELADVRDVERKQIRLLDSVHFYMDSSDVQLGDIISRSKGLQLMSSERTSWDALLSNRIELLEYETVNKLSTVESTIATLKSKSEGLMDFLYPHVLSGDSDDKLLFVLLLDNVMESQRRLQEGYTSFLEHRSINVEQALSEFGSPDHG